MKSPRAAPARPFRESWLYRHREWLGLALVGGLAVFFLATSWRKWPDPLVDFSRELYVPWRLSQGAVLYRDVDDIFGPLSQYVNAGLFRLFGPGLMILVAANLAVFAAIAAALYLLFRRAWGSGAALVSAAVFVSVFGFSQYIDIGNYNYATPYCHEATHGLLVCLLLVMALARWMEEATVFRSFIAGGLLGLTAVLKPDIMFAGGLVTLAALAVQLRRGGFLRPRAIAAWAAGTALPTVGFTAYFAAYMPWKASLALACRGWLNVITTERFTGEQVQTTFLGFDRPLHHLREHGVATLLALLLIAWMSGLAWLADRSASAWRRFLLGGLLTGGILWVSCCDIIWIRAGRCLLGLTLIYVVYCAAAVIRKPGAGSNPRVQALRLLIAVLAAALMGRMLLNGRIYHYGFYQAALAGMLVPAVLIGELPMRMGLGRCGRNLAVAGALLLLAPGVFGLAEWSQNLLQAKTYAVADGLDRFYTQPPKDMPVGAILQTLSKWLRQAPRGQTLVVLPEGAMINYLARMPSSVAPFVFFAATTAHGREASIVKDLQQHPPDWVVIISRDLREYGVARYGRKSGEGLELLTWVSHHYEPVVSIGDNPLDPERYGGMVLKRKN